LGLLRDDDGKSDGEDGDGESDGGGEDDDGSNGISFPGRQVRSDSAVSVGSSSGESSSKGSESRSESGE
ncbi:hypothetical protein Tco_1464341, partial [Tanacetum coccineum]